MCSFTKIGSFLGTCVLLSIVLGIPESTGALNEKSYKDALKKFAQVENWSLNNIGASSAALVRIFLPVPVYRIVDYAVRGAFKNKFLQNAFSYTFLLQIPFTIAVVMGYLIVFLLLALPFLIAFYGNRQARLCSHIRKHDSKSWLMLSMFVMCCILAIIFALILSVSTIRGYHTLTVPFKFAAFSVSSGFDLRPLLQRNFQNNLRGLSHNAFDSSMILYHVNFAVATSLIAKMEPKFQSVLKFAGTMGYQLSHAAEVLEHHRSHLYQIVNETSAVTKDQTYRFNDAVERLIDMHSAAKEDLEPLRNIPQIVISADAVQTLDKPVEMLQNVSSGNLQAGFQAVFMQMSDIASDPHFDPSELILKIRHAVFEIEGLLRPPVERYIAFVEGSFMEEDQIEVIQNIRMIESDFHRAAYAIYVLLLLFSISCIIFSVIIAIVHILAVTRANRVQKDSEANGDVDKKHVQHTIWLWRVLLFCCYIISGFLALFWTVKMFLFLFSSLSTEVCMSLEDKSIFDATFDHTRFRAQPHWYSLFSSLEFNMTMKNSLHRCDLNQSYLYFISDAIVSKKNPRSLLKDLNLTGPTSTYEKGIQNLTTFNASLDSLVVNTDALAGVNLHPPFQVIQDYMAKLVQLNASAILRKIDSSARMEKISQIIKTAIESYELLRNELRSRFAMENQFNKSLISINSSLMAVQKEMTDLIWVSSALHKFVVKESPGIYRLILNETITEMVDAIFFELKLDIINFRNSLTFCRELSLIYQKGVVAVCQVMLYPISICWFSSLLVCCFLLGAVWLSVTRVPFLELPNGPETYEERRRDDDFGSQSSTPNHQRQPKELDSNTEKPSSIDSDYSGARSGGENSNSPSRKRSLDAVTPERKDPGPKIDPTVLLQSDEDISIYVQDSSPPKNESKKKSI